MSQMPPITLETDVIEAWIDHNNHLNMGYYMVVFDNATDVWLRDFLGLSDAYRAENHVTTFSLEGHITYDAEVGLGDRLQIRTRLVDFDAKRIHYFHEMYHADQGYLASTNELMTLHVSQETRRAAPMPEYILQGLEKLKAAHSQLPPHAKLGRSVGLHNRKKT